MRDIDFDEPVDVLVGSSKIIQIRSAEAAARHLLERWPTKGGAKHRAARQALVDLLEGKIIPAVARQAFADAADEAEIRVGGWHANNPVAVFLSKHRSTAKAPVPRPRKR